MIKKILLLTLLILYTGCIALCGEYRETDTLIIFDQSASMYGLFGNKIKYKYAQNIVYQIIRNFSSSKAIGLRTVSDNPPANYEKYSSKTLCQFTVLKNDIRKFNNENIANTVNNIIPGGNSPIELTLRKAILEDFYGNTNLKHIILITDGYENCGGNPCKFIKEVMQNRDDIVIDIIALSVDSDIADKLKCISDATRGKTYNISHPVQISPVVNDVVNNPQINNKEKPPIGGTPNNNINQNVNSKQIIYKNYLLKFFD